MKKDVPLRPQTSMWAWQWFMQYLLIDRNLSPTKYDTRCYIVIHIIIVLYRVTFYSQTPTLIVNILIIILDIRNIYKCSCLPVNENSPCLHRAPKRLFFFTKMNPFQDPASIPQNLHYWQLAIFCTKGLIHKLIYQKYTNIYILILFTI